MLVWILQSFLRALWMIFAKKVWANRQISNNWQNFFSRITHIIVILVLIFFGIFWFKYEIKWEYLTVFNISLFVVAVLAIYITYPLRRIAYLNEKISVLQPFTMLFQVFPVIIWFIFIATERLNVITFLMSLLASFVVILSSIDFKSLKINKYSMMVLASSIIKSIQIFAILYFLKFIPPETLYLTESIAIAILSISIIIFNKEIYQAKLLTKDYIFLMTKTNVILLWSLLIALNMYINLWIVATSLIWLIYLVFIYILWYIFLKEIPAKKDVLVALFVAICVIIWMRFKK